jgi:serine/threonine-protein kinase
MAKPTVPQLVDLVKRSGLIDDVRLTQALSDVDLASVNDSGIVASILTKAGLLTEWQSEKLLQGRHKGFYLGKYKLLNHIGTGGMGAVYLAEHRVMRHRVAIKLLPTHLASQSSYLERFHQEARASARLNHPNMVRASDVDSDDNIHYLVMEYVEGSDLQAIVSRNGPLPYQMAADYTRQAAEGLAYAHRSGLIHRDIKPANLLVDKTGTVKILDMGLARFSDETQGSLTVAYDQKMIGTVDYLAPEQALNSHNVDARVDIYSLGCTLYFMLTGDAPFPEGTISQRLMQHQTAEPTDVRKTRPDAPEALLRICRKMMAKAASDRYQTADDVALALAEWLEIGADGAASLRNPPPSGPSQNDDLDLAPLDDEPGGRGSKPGDSKASGIGSKSGISVTGGSGIKQGSSPSLSKGESSGARSASKSGVKSGVKSSGPPPVVNKEKDLMDDLLAASALPPTEPLRSAPLTTKSLQSDDTRTPIGMIIGGLVGGAVVIYLLLYLLFKLTNI